MDQWRAVPAVPPPVPEDHAAAAPASSAQIDALLSSAGRYGTNSVANGGRIDFSSIDSIDAALALTQSRLGSLGKPAATVDATSRQMATSATTSTALSASYTGGHYVFASTGESSTPSIPAASGHRDGVFRESRFGGGETETAAQQLKEALADRNAAEREISMLSTQLRTNDAMAVEWESDLRWLREELSSARRMLAEIDTHPAGPGGSLGSDLQSLLHEFRSQLARLQGTLAGCATHSDLDIAVQRAAAAAQERQAAAAHAQHSALQADMHRHAASHAARSKAELVALERAMATELGRVTEAHDQALRVALDHNGRLEEALAAARGAKARLEGQVSTLQGKVEELGAAAEGAQGRQAAALEAARHGARTLNATAAAGMQRLDSHVGLLQNTHRELSTALEDVRYKEQKLRAQAAALAEQENQLQEAKAEHQEALRAAEDLQAHVDERLAEAHRSGAAAEEAGAAAADHERKLKLREAALADATAQLEVQRSKLAQATAAHSEQTAQLQGRLQAVGAREEAAAEAAQEAAAAQAAAVQETALAKQSRATADAATADAQRLQAAVEARETAAAAASVQLETATASLRAAQAVLATQQQEVQEAEAAAAQARLAADAQVAAVQQAEAAAAAAAQDNANATMQLRSEQTELQEERTRVETLLAEARLAEQAAVASQEQEQAGAGLASAEVGKLKEQLAALKLDQQDQQAHLVEVQASLEQEQGRAAAEAEHRQTAELAAEDLRARLQQLQAQLAAAQTASVSTSHVAESKRQAAASELALQHTAAQNEELRAALAAARTEHEVHVAALLALRQHLGAVLGRVGEAMLSRVGGGSVAPPPTWEGVHGGAMAPLGTADARRVQQVLQLVGVAGTPHAAVPAGLVPPPMPFPGGGASSPSSVPELQLPQMDKSPGESVSDNSYSTNDGSDADEGGSQNEEQSEEEHSPQQGGGGSEPPVQRLPGEGFVTSSGIIGLVMHCGRMGARMDTAQGEAAELGATALSNVSPECPGADFLQPGDTLLRAVWPAVVPVQGSFTQLAAEHGDILPEGALKLQGGALGAVDVNLQDETVYPAQQRLRSLLARAAAHRPLVLLFQRHDAESSDGDQNE